MNNINRRRYVLSFRSFTYFCIFLFLIISSFLLYFNKNNLIETSENIIQSFSENFQYQFTKFDISGLEKIELQFVEDKLQNYIETSIFLLPFDQINRSIKENNWIKSISLKTNYKDTLFVKIEEYRPLGIYNFNNKFFFFNENGKIIDEFKTTNNGNNSLIIFKGQSSNLEATSLINILEESNFQDINNIKYVEFLNKRRWDIYLKNNKKLMLSENNPIKSLKNFLKIYDNFGKNDKDSIIIYDLRDLDKTLVMKSDD